MRPTRTAAAFAVAVTLGLTGTACSGDDDVVEDDVDAEEVEPVQPEAPSDNPVGGDGPIDDDDEDG